MQTNGPWGGYIGSIVINNSKVLIGSHSHGVRYSTDNGLTWPETSLNNGWVTSLNLIGTTLFAGVFGAGIYISTDFGVSWIQSSSNFGDPACFIQDSANILSGAPGGVSKSTDNGSTWTSLGLGQEAVYSLAISGPNILAGTLANGIYYSSDNGLNWTQSSFNHYPGIVSTMLVSGSKIFAGTLSGAPYVHNGVYVSTDNGLTWSQSSLNERDVLSFTAAGSVIYGATDRGLFQTTDEGLTWHQNLLYEHTINAFVENGTYYFAGTGGAGILVSSNSGVSWRRCQLDEQITYCFALNGQNILAGSVDVSITTDNGDNWMQSEPDTLYADALAAKGSYLFAGNVWGVYRSTDGGLNWTQTPLNNYWVQCLTVSGANILAGVAPQHSGECAGICVSSDNGDSWNYINLSDCVLCFTVNGLYTYAGGENGKVFVSTDNGWNWNQTSLAGNSVFSLASTASNVFAGTQTMQGPSGVFVSSNNGENWSLTSLNYKQINALVVNGGNVFAGTESYGIYASTNNGLTWVQKNENLGDLNIKSLTISNGYIFAGTYGSSVWRRLLSDIIEVKNISAQTPKIFNLYQNFPNPFNPVTKIKFSLPNPSKGGALETRLAIYDILGRKVTTLVNENLKPGEYETEWDGSNFTSGVYFYQLTVSSGQSTRYSQTKKLVLIK